MIRNFICLNCKQQFKADDKEMVYCPHCKSDNVEIAKQHISRWVWRIMSLIIVLLVVCFIFNCISRCNSGNDSDIINPDDPAIIYTDGDSIVDPPTVIISEPIWDNDSKYSVKVEAKNIKSKMKIYFVMLSHFEQKVLQKNNDGLFSNIPHCDDDGHSYDFAIMDSKTDTLLCVPIEQTGFVKQITIDDKNKMTIEKLQTYIDSQDRSLLGVGENEYLAPDYKLEFVGIPADTRKPESWSELFEMIEYGIIQNASVININYDDKKRINIIKLKVTM